MKFILLVGCVIALWLFNGFIYPMWVTDHETRALVGDSFGSVNALFSGLAFAGLIYTILIQRKELALQREELRLQRAEMKDSRGELELQNKIQKAQAEIMIAQIKAMGSNARIEYIKAAAELEESILRFNMGIDIKREADEIERIGVSLGEKYFPMLGPDDERAFSLNDPPEK